MNLFKLFSGALMNEAAADGAAAGASGGESSAPAAAPTPAPAAAPAAAPAESGSLMGDLGAKPAAPEAAKPEGQAAPTDKPAVPESYTFNLPEGEELHEAAAPMMQEFFKELGFSQEQADKALTKLMEIDAARQPTEEQIQQHYIEQATALNKAWADECRKLPDIGGANFDKSLETCAKVMTKFGTPELRDFLTSSALGSNPVFFKFIHAIGSAMSQDTLEHGGDAGKGPRSIESKLWPALPQ